MNVDYCMYFVLSTVRKYVHTVWYHVSMYPSLWRLEVVGSVHMIHDLRTRLERTCSLVIVAYALGGDLLAN